MIGKHVIFYLLVTIMNIVKLCTQNDLFVTLQYIYLIINNNTHRYLIITFCFFIQLVILNNVKFNITCGF